MTGPDGGWALAQERARSLAAGRRLEVEHLALSRIAGRILASDIVQPSTSRSTTDTASLILETGQVLTPARLALAASWGLATLPASRKPSVAVYTVGDDLVAPGRPLPPGHRFDYPRELLMGLLRADGLEPTAWPRLPDDPAQLEIAVRDAACAFDLVVVCGDSPLRLPSPLAEVIGRFGHLESGALPDNSGCPAIFGHLDQAIVLGLPAGALDLMASWMTVGRALIDPMQGRREMRRRLFGQLAAPLTGAAAYAPVSVEYGEAGDVRLSPARLSGPLEMLAGSDGLAVLPDGQPRVAGDVVEVLTYA